MSWSGRVDLNHRPPRPERGALTPALRPEAMYYTPYRDKEAFESLPWVLYLQLTDHQLATPS